MWVSYPPLRPRLRLRLRIEPLANLRLTLALTFGTDAHPILLKGLLRLPAMLQSETTTYIERGCPDQKHWEKCDKTTREIALQHREEEPAKDGQQTSKHSEAQQHEGCEKCYD